MTNRKASRGELVLRVGGQAYYETASGHLVRCWVKAIVGEPGIASTAQRVTVKVTARKSLYARGEELKVFALHVIPRAAVKQRRLGYRISPYTVEV